MIANKQENFPNSISKKNLSTKNYIASLEFATNLTTDEDILPLAPSSASVSPFSSSKEPQEILRQSPYPPFPLCSRTLICLTSSCFIALTTLLGSLPSNFPSIHRLLFFLLKFGLRQHLVQIWPGRQFLPIASGGLLKASLAQQMRPVADDVAEVLSTTL